MVALRAHLRPAMANMGAAQVESKPEARRDSNRLVIEGKAARCNWHCHQPVRRVKAGYRIQPGPADQIISSERISALSLSTTSRYHALCLVGYGTAGSGMDPLRSSMNSSQYS